MIRERVDAKEEKRLIRNKIRPDNHKNRIDIKSRKLRKSINKTEKINDKTKNILDTKIGKKLFYVFCMFYRVYTKCKAYLIKKCSLSSEEITHIIYLSQVLSFLFGITAVFGVIINYLKLSEVRDTWLESHFLWQIKTFWIGLLFGFIGLIFIPVLIGFLILAVDLVWIIYRTTKGWISLCENIPVKSSSALI